MIVGNAWRKLKFYTHLYFPTEIKYTFELDEELVVKRVYLYDGKKIFKREGNVILNDKNVTVCTNFTEIRVEVCVYSYIVCVWFVVSFFSLTHFNRNEMLS